MAPHPSSAPVHLLIGGYTAEMEGSATGVSTVAVTFDGAGASQAATRGATAVTSPSYLIRHPEQPWIFAVSESEPGVLSSFRVDEGGALTPLTTVTMTADGPCHLAVAPDGEHLVVANYLSGSLASFAIAPDGSLSDTLDLCQLTGSGPVPERQDGPRAHQVVWDGDELLVCDLGTDRVHRLALTGDGRFTVAAPPLELPTGSGPRHLVVVADHLVVACELSAELWLARRGPAGWEALQTLPSSAATVDVPIYPSAIVAEGLRVFVANRGAGTVGTFDLDTGAGRLDPVAEFPCGGDWPRDLALTAGRLWVANQTNDLVTVFSTGTLPPAEPELEFASPSPACLLVLTD